MGDEGGERKRQKGEKQTNGEKRAITGENGGMGKGAGGISSVTAL